MGSVGLKRNLIVVISIVMVTALLGGCSTLKKKFVRQKKKTAESEKIIPVLNPIEYEPKVVSAEERYRYHYSMWQVWHRDLINAIVEKRSGKKQKYLITQCAAQLTEMKGWIDTSKQTELQMFITNLQNIEQAYQRPDLMRNTFSIRKKLQANAKNIRAQFKPALMEAHYFH